MSLTSSSSLYPFPATLDLIFDLRWKTIIQRLFPECTFIEGTVNLFPVTNILLFSGVSLDPYLINLSSASFLLLVSKSSNMPHGSS